MKILILSINDNLGGAELYLKNLAHYFKDEDLTIAFLRSHHTNNWDDLSKHAKIKVYSKHSKFLGWLNFIMRTIFKRQSYDYVFTSHIHTNATVSSLRSFGFLRTKSLICRESTSIFLRFKGLKLFTYKLFYKLGYRKIDLLICQTELMKQQLLNNFKRLGRTTQVEVIPNPIDLRRIRQMAQEKAKYDFDYLVTAGRLIAVKGHDILIKAFANIRSDHGGLKLIILGEGELKQELKALTTKLDIEDAVIFEGHVANVYPYFKGARACVISSRIEGFPNVLLQMMSQNVNVVSTECAGGIDQIHGLYTCPPASVDDLEMAITECLKHDNQGFRSDFDAVLQQRDISHFFKSVKSYLDK